MKRSIKEEKEIKRKLETVTTQIPGLIEQLFDIQKKYLDAHADMDEAELQTKTKKILPYGMQMVYRKAILACGIREQDLGNDVSAVMQSSVFNSLQESDKKQLLDTAKKYNQAMNNLEACITDDLVNEFVNNSKKTYAEKQALINKTTVLAILATLLFITAVTALILSFGILGPTIPVGIMVATTLLSAAAEVPVIMNLNNASEELELMDASNSHSKQLETECTQLIEQLKSELSTTLKPEQKEQKEQENSQLLKRFGQMEALNKHNNCTKATPTQNTSPHDRTLKPLENACEILNDIVNPSKGVGR